MEYIKTAIQVVTIIVALWLAQGCGAGFMSAKTETTYEISADGIKKISYISTKEQQGLSLDLQEENGKIKSVKIRADKSTTNDESVAASLAILLKVQELIQTLTALAEKAALAGGS